MARNYKAMGDAKLIRTEKELAGEYGEAMRKTDNPRPDLLLVRALLKERGLGDSRFDTPAPPKSVKAVATLPLAPRPMLCHDVKGDLDLVPADWPIEQKLDGIRLMVVRTEDGVRTFGGRNGNEHTGGSPLVEQELLKLPPGTILDGEQVNGDGELTYRADGELGDGVKRFVAFDVLQCGSQDVRGQQYGARRTLLEAMFWALKFDDQIRLVEQSTDHAMHDAWLEAGFEGSVAKNPAGLYREGKRSRDMLKCKPQATADAVIVGYEMGKGQSNKHKVGALKISMLASDDMLTGAETSVGWSGTPEEAEALFGRIVEIRHHGISKTGKPRHPVKPRLRPDLDPVT